MTQKRAVLVVCDGLREDSSRPEWMSNLCRLMVDGRRFTAYGSAFITIRGGFGLGLVHDGGNSAVDLTATILCPSANLLTVWTARRCQSVVTQGS